MSLITDAKKLIWGYATFPGQDNSYMASEAQVWLSRVGKMPKVVCLCGSTRFLEEFHKQTAIETLAGHIVLSVGLYVRELDGKQLPFDHAGEALGEEVKQGLDDLHKRKIDLSDEIFVLNVGGYVGESTRSEIAYALEHNTMVRYLE